MMHLFYGGPFSQWAHSPMLVRGQSYDCAEQWMMASKARYFGDGRALNAIMAAVGDPAEQKRIGRRVKNFDAPAWAQIAPYIVYEGNVAKFTQNVMLRKALLATRSDELVEASPTDTIWGVGLSEDDPRAFDKSQWRGQNLLGEILMRVRSTLCK